MMDTQSSVSSDASSAAALTDGLNEDFSTDENEIVAQGKRVVSGLRSGVRAVIDACVLTATTCQRFPDSIDEFLAVLVAGNIISRAERRLGPASPKLSKLRTIGNHAELLNREEVFPHLVSGFTVIHQLVVLYKNLDGDGEARVGKLVDIIKLQPTLSMDFLKEQTDIAKSSTASKVTNDSAAFTEVPACNTDSAPGVGSSTYDLVLLSPDPGDVRRLSEDYPESDDLPRCLRVHEVVDADTIAVVIARLADLPTIVNRLLSYCGIDRVSRVMLAREPLDRDVTNAEVVVVADRGRGRFELPRDFAWPVKGEIDPVSIATRLAPDSSNRLHLFAPRKSDGWTSVIGDENWERIDE